jgi:UDP-N-acetyl-D-glucosamine dehydrogenase
VTTPSPLDGPEAFFADARWTIGVIGLGYVGLPLLMTAVDRGLGAIGFDISEDRVARMNDGHSPIDDVADETLAAALAAGAEITADPARLADADALMICVPSPLGSHRQPDLSYIQAAVDTIRTVIRPGHLVCLESTTYPGTTDERVLPAMIESGLRLDEDVWVAYSPERVSPGEVLTTGEIPKIVGGVSENSTRVAAAAYRRLVPEVHVVSSSRAAEMAKLLENTYRAVNIGLINEMAQLAHVLDIDVWELIDAAATKPFGYQAFWPGPGVGGHCIPLDPQYLAWRAREARFTTRFIDLADQVNTAMPEYVVERVTRLLSDRERPVFGSRVLAVGAAYKPNVSDHRESASIRVVEILLERGADVRVLDPVVGSDRLAQRGMTPIEPDADLVGYDIAVILTDHDGIDYDRIADAVPVVFDTRGVYRRTGRERDDVVAL